MPITDEQALNHYIGSTSAEAKAIVCSHHVEGFAKEFAARYEEWRKANAEALARGAQLAEARGMNGPTPPNLKTFASMQAQLLEALPEDDRQRRCNELLSSLLQAQAK
jgi:post-segregation antitoxin (ccd killing protein)